MITSRSPFFSHRNRLFAAAAAIVAVAVLIYSRRGGDQKTSAEVAPEARAEYEVPGDDASPQNYTWRVGDVAAYDMRSVTQILPARSDYSIQGPGETRVEAVWHWRVCRVGPAEVEWQCAFTQPKITVEGARVPVLESLLEETPVLQVRSPSGSLLRQVLPEGLPREDHDFLAGLGRLEVALPEGGLHRETREWRIITEDGNGRFTRIYQRNAADGSAQISFHRGDLVQAALETGGAVVEPLRSWGRAVLGPVWLETYDAEESLRYVSGGSELMQVRVQGSLKRRASPESGPAWASSLGADTDWAAVVRAWPVVVPGQGEWVGAFGQMRRERMLAQQRTWSLDMLWDQLVLVARPEVDYAESMPALARLRDWLILNPSQADGLAKRLIANRNVDPLATGLMIHALELAAAHEPAIQRSLVRLLEPGVPQALALQAAVAAGGLQGALAPELKHSLWQLAFGTRQGESPDLQSTAQLSLGIWASSRPEIAQELAAVLVPTVQSPDADQDAVETAFLALGNARLHNPEAIKAAEDWWRFDDPLDGPIPVRAMDYLVQLRELTPSDLLDTLENRPGVSLRERAADHLSQVDKLPEGAPARLATVINDDSVNMSLRMRALNVLVAHAERDRESLGTIRQLEAQPNFPAELRAVLTGENDAASAGKPRTKH